MATRRLPTDERWDLIADAAGRLFAARGYDGTRLDAVAAAAGVTKPILYRHAAGKEALYLAVLDRHRADLGSKAQMLEIALADLAQMLPRCADHPALQ